MEAKINRALIGYFTKNIPPALSFEHSFENFLILIFSKLLAFCKEQISKFFKKIIIKNKQ